MNVLNEISKLTEPEKEAYIEGIEVALDFGDYISPEDYALYEALIEERASKEGQQPSLNAQIESAEARQGNQDSSKDSNSFEQGR